MGASSRGRRTPTPPTSGKKDEALEGTIFDDECRNLGFYEQESLRYYVNIVAKFSKPVLNAIAKLSALDIRIIAAWRDDKFDSAMEIVEKLPDEIVGQVPEVTRLNGKGPLLLEDGEDRHMYLESYRNLRSALLFLAVEGARPKLLLITSALPNEGKSTISVNLARTLAQGGARVLLVDGRAPKGLPGRFLNCRPELFRRPLKQAPVIFRVPARLFCGGGFKLEQCAQRGLACGLRQPLASGEEVAQLAACHSQQPVTELAPLPVVLEFLHRLREHELDRDQLLKVGLDLQIDLRVEIASGDIGRA
jgi:hypothetical protein